MAKVTRSDTVKIELSGEEAEELMAILGCGMGLVNGLFDRLYEQQLKGHIKYKVTAKEKCKHARFPIYGLKVERNV